MSATLNNIRVKTADASSRKPTVSLSRWKEIGNKYRYSGATLSNCGNFLKLWILSCDRNIAMAKR
jgi:hypothetical protein